MAIQNHAEPMLLNLDETRLWRAPVTTSSGAIARTEHGDLYGALSDAERAVDLNPKDGDAYLTRGRGNAGIGRHEQAIVDFTQAPDYPDNSYFPRPMFLFFCYWDKADSKVALGNQAGAIADYDSAIKCNPNIPEVYHNRGHCKAELGNHAGAIADYGRAIKLNINIPEVYHNRGHCKAELGDHAGAIADYDHAIKLNQTDAAAYLNRGISKAELGDHAGAIADYDHAIKMNTKYAEAHYGRGQAKFLLGDYAGAIADYGRAIVLGANYNSDLVATAYYNIGLSKVYLGDWENAIADFRCFIDLAPDDPDGYYQRGNCRIYRGDWDDAIDDCTRAMSLNPDLSVNCYSIIGFAKGWKEDYHGALAAYDSAVTLNPDFVPVYYNRGVTEAYQGNHDSAIGDFNRVLELDNEHAGAYLQRGYVKATQGDYDGAIADYNQAMALDPNQSSTYYMSRAVANLRKGDDHAAKADCELAGVHDVASLLATELGRLLYSMSEPTAWGTSDEPPVSDMHQLLEIAEDEKAEKDAEKDAEIERLQMRLAEFEEEAVVERERARSFEEQLEATRQQWRLVYSYRPIDDHEQAEPKTAITPATPHQVHYYTDSNDGDPFRDWLGQIDSADRQHIRNAIRMMEQGHLGDNKPLRGKSGLFERRLSAHRLRIYFSKESKTSLLILAGGVKPDQDADIDKAMERLADHKRRRSGPGEP